MVTVQVEEVSDLHELVQPTKFQPGAAVAVRVTRAPPSNEAVHVATQSIPPGLDDTEPAPCADTTTVRLRVVMIGVIGAGASALVGGTVMDGGDVDDGDSADAAAGPATVVSGTAGRPLDAFGGVLVVGGTTTGGGSTATTGTVVGGIGPICSAAGGGVVTTTGVSSDVGGTVSSVTSAAGGALGGATSSGAA